MLEGRERWTHSNPLNAQTVTMIHRAEQTQWESVCASGWSRESERERWREREKERGSGRGMTGENWRRRARTQEGWEARMDVVCTHIQAPVTFKPTAASTSAEVCMARTSDNKDWYNFIYKPVWNQCSFYNCTSVYPSAHFHFCTPCTHYQLFTWKWGKGMYRGWGGGEWQVGMLRQHDSK